MGGRRKRSTGANSSTAGVEELKNVSPQNCIGHLREFSLKTDWSVYKIQLMQYFVCNNVVDEKRKKAVLLNALTEDAFSFKEDNEKVNDWLVRVTGLVSHCDFGPELTVVLRDRFIMGLGKGKIMERLFEEDVTTLTLQRAVELASAKEAASNDYELPSKLDCQPEMAAQTIKQTTRRRNVMRGIQQIASMRIPKHYRDILHCKLLQKTREEIISIYKIFKKLYLNEEGMLGRNPQFENIQFLRTFGPLEKF
ncbi:hypothetical protein O3M35_012505 [Rhynocoris fuscipes]|uniref:Uncharacterized protein n=1 Tax=Rhynocoris fuscipes TaxID=488301 RepID=A0AAW1CW39_9HEMI